MARYGITLKVLQCIHMRSSRLQNDESAGGNDEALAHVSAALIVCNMDLLGVSHHCRTVLV